MQIGAEIRLPEELKELNAEQLAMIFLMKYWMTLSFHFAYIFLFPLFWVVAKILLITGIVNTKQE